MSLKIDSLLLVPRASPPSNPVTGQIYFDTDGSMYAYDGSAWVIFASPFPSARVFVATADATVGNTIDEGTLIGSGVGSLTLPAAFFTVGRTLRIHSSGHHSATGTATITLRVKLGSVEVLASAPFYPMSVSTKPWSIDTEITCRSTGASGTVMAQGVFRYYTESEPDNGESCFPMGGTTTVTIDTTGTLAVNMTADWGTAAVGNTITGTNVSLEIMN